MSKPMMPITTLKWEELANEWLESISSTHAAPYLANPKKYKCLKWNIMNNPHSDGLDLFGDETYSSSLVSDIKLYANTQSSSDISTIVTTTTEEERRFAEPFISRFCCAKRIWSKRLRWRICCYCWYWY